MPVSTPVAPANTGKSEHHAIIVVNTHAIVTEIDLSRADSAL